MLEAQKNTRQNEKNYHETLVLLKRAQAWNPPAANQADRVLIQSLEEQLNDAHQQLNQLRAGHAPSAAEGQMAVQQSQTNEQLEALCADCNKLNEVVQKAITDRNNIRRANVQLRMQSLQYKANSTTENSALRVCRMKAKIEVSTLQGENEILKQMSAEQESTTANSATLGPLSFPALSGMESGLTTQASPQLGGGMSGLGTP